MTSLNLNLQEGWNSFGVSEDGNVTGNAATKILEISMFDNKTKLYTKIEPSEDKYYLEKFKGYSIKVERPDATTEPLDLLLLNNGDSIFYYRVSAEERVARTELEGDNVAPGLSDDAKIKYYSSKYIATDKYGNHLHDDEHHDEDHDDDHDDDHENETYILYRGLKALGGQYEEPDSAWEALTIQHGEGNVIMAAANYPTSNDASGSITTVGVKQQFFTAKSAVGMFEGAKGVLVRYDNASNVEERLQWNQLPSDESKFRRVEIVY